VLDPTTRNADARAIQALNDFLVTDPRSSA
jgi:hypothetical protein